MAILLEDLQETIEVISRLDSAVTCDEAAYDTYLETLDESLLALDLEQEPVRFVLKLELDYKAQRQIKKDQVSVGTDGGMGVNMGFTMLEIKLALVDIKNPGTEKLRYLKDRDGYADNNLIARLDAYGILQDLYTARQNALKKPVNKKKS